MTDDDGDAKPSLEKYLDQIIDLQKQGRPVGGIGIQGHMDSPIGQIIRSTLDKLSILGIPILFTEADASSLNKHVRVDDLKVMLRECSAHPAMDGKLFMSLENSHLINMEAEENAAGERLLELKERTSHTHGMIDEEVEFYFRRFQGSYEVEIVSARKKVRWTIAIRKEEYLVKVCIDM